MGLRPVLVNPRTLVRTWGTRKELVRGEEWMTTPRFISPLVGKASGQLYGEPHTWSLPVAQWRDPQFLPGHNHTNKWGAPFWSAPFLHDSNLRLRLAFRITHAGRER